MLGWLFLFSCNKSTLVAFPSSLDWGEVDFSLAVPEEGFNPQSVTIRNNGESATSAEIYGFDFDHLCLAGFSSVPAEIGDMEPEDEFLLTVGVCDYAPDNGERDSTVEGVIEISYEKEILSIPWTFIPVLGLTEDSG